MIKFTREILSLDISKEQFKKEKNDALMYAIKSGQVIKPEELNQMATSKLINEKVSEFANHLRENQINILPIGRPYVSILENNENLKANIYLIRYDLEEILKFDLKSVKIDFKENFPLDQLLNDVREDFRKKRPVYKDVLDRDIIEKDIVLVDLVATKDGKIIHKQDHIKLQAKKSDTFSINNELIGQKIGNEFSFNDPENVFWTVKIISAQIVEVQELTEANFEPMIEENINTIQELRNEFESNIKKEFAGRELLRFFDEYVYKLIEENQIDVAQEVIDETINSLAQREMNPNGLLANIDSLKNIDMQNPMHVEFLQSATFYAKRSVITEFVFKAIKEAVEIMPTQEILENELKFINKTINNRSENEVKFTPDKVMDILTKHMYVIELVRMFNSNLAQQFETLLRFK